MTHNQDIERARDQTDVTVWITVHIPKKNARTAPQNIQGSSFFRLWMSRLRRLYQWRRVHSAASIRRTRSASS